MKAWDGLMLQALGGTRTDTMVCPRCASAGLELRMRRMDPVNGWGFAVLRCSNCVHGTHFSRVEVSEAEDSGAMPEDWLSTTLD